MNFHDEIMDVFRMELEYNFSLEVAAAIFVAAFLNARIFNEDHI